MTRKHLQFVGIAVIALAGGLVLLMLPRGESPASSQPDAPEIAEPTSRPQTTSGSSPLANSSPESSRLTTAVTIPNSQPSQPPQTASVPIVQNPAPATMETIVSQPPAQSPQQVATALRTMIANASVSNPSGNSASPQPGVLDTGSTQNPSASTSAPFVAPSGGIAIVPQQPASSPSSTPVASEILIENSPTGDVLEIQFPPGARLPAALSSGPQDQELSPAQLSLKDAIAQDFLEQTATATPDGGDVAAWNRLAIEADERLRKMIGHDAFNRMALSASQEAIEQQPTQPPPAEIPPQEIDVVTPPSSESIP